jgi:hypothetical protein
MFANTQLPDPASIEHRKELDRLYARRSAIDALIESLEKYATYASPQDGNEQQTA